MSEVFPVTSRYYALPTRQVETPDGKTHVYLARRFLPPAESLELVAEHTVADGERLDHVAHRRLGDAELYWRVCDANDALRPEELESVGRKLRITLPEGVTGALR